MNEAKKERRARTMTEASIEHNRKVSAQALESRWGAGGRPPGAQIRVDKDAADLLAKVPDKDRRTVASNAVRKAARDYLGMGEDADVVDRL